MAWNYIKLMSLLGAISSYNNSKKQFDEQYHHPYKAGKLLTRGQDAKNKLATDK